MTRRTEQQQWDLEIGLGRTLEKLIGFTVEKVIRDGTDPLRVFFALRLVDPDGNRVEARICADTEGKEPGYLDVGKALSRACKVAGAVSNKDIARRWHGRCAYSACTCECHSNKTRQAKL